MLKKTYTLLISLINWYFDKFTMLDASILAPYIGFTKDEVQELCKKI